MSSSSILHEAGGGNEKVMRLFLPPALLEKTDEPELANKVKTITGRGWEGERRTCTHTHTYEIKRDVLVYS